MYLNQTETFTPEQITTMVFTKLKECAEIALKTKVVDVVISVSITYLFHITVFSLNIIL